MLFRHRRVVDFSGVRISTARFPQFWGLLIFLWLSVLPSLGLAQSDRFIPAADTSSPRDTLRSFIEGCNEIYEIIEKDGYLDPSTPEHAAIAFRILDCLDLTELPAFSREEQAGEIAICIKEILDRVELPPWEEIPDVDEIEVAGGFEKVPRWRIPGTRITIARMDEGPQKHEYLFSAGTVGRAVEYYNSVSSKKYRTDGPDVSEGFYQWYLTAPRSPMIANIVDKLPPWIRNGRTFGMARWKWLCLILAILIAAGFMTISFRLYGKLPDKVEDTSLFKYWMTLSLPIFAACVPLGFLYVVRYIIGVRGTPLYLTEFLSIMTALAAASVVVFATTTRVTETIIASPRVNPQGLNAQLIRISSKLLGLTAVLILLFYGGQYLGIPVGTLLASAGIGGIALALGAQDTLKDLFGTVSLMADKPFRVGERIILDNYDGVVEDIGLRSTKLRLLTGHLVTLPNEHLARSNVENVGQRPYIRRDADIHLPLDTPRESLERALAIIRSALEEHDGMDPDFPPRAFFTDYLPTAFNIRVIYWYNPPNYWDFLEMSEKVNLAIFRAFEAEGIQFSLPTRLAYTSVDSQEKPVEVKMVGEAESA